MISFLTLLWRGLVPITIYFEVVSGFVSPSNLQLNSMLTSNLQKSKYVSRPLRDLSELHQFHDAFSQITQSTSSFFNQFIATSIDLPEINLVDESSSLNPLGNDLLAFLFATIGIVPLFKWLNASPVIGFLTAGLIMGPAGFHVFSDLNDMESIADFGVLFLLFEQGLELTVERLTGLSKYAFGMGSLQVLLSSSAFFIFPFIGGVQFLEFFVGAQPALVDITRIDESLVIGVALSLSSSAFCLKILQEKHQLSTNFGAAALGILLFQDIAVVPLLVLLPIIENSSGPMTIEGQMAVLGLTFAKALFGLGGILIFGGRIVRYLFSLVAQTKSSETFVALCLVVALGTGALTDWLGLSSTLGAFTAGTLLAESNYRTQIESDIKPFRGLLLGLFFITTGASVQPDVIQSELPTVLALLAGLISFKAIIITSLGPFFGLTKTESVRTGMLLSGGGEFAFVVLTLADKLHVLPDKLAKILVGVVVLSMALTPYLSNLGDKIANWLEEGERAGDIQEATKLFEEPQKTATLGDDSIDEAVVICGFNNLGSGVASFLSAPVFFGADETAWTTNANGEIVIKETPRSKPIQYVAFDLDPNVVIKGYRRGHKVLYGDGCQPLVLLTAGVQRPRAFVVTYPEQVERVKAVEALRQAFPSTPIISRTAEVEEYYELMEAGASAVCIQEREASYSMFSSLLSAIDVTVAPPATSMIPQDDIPRIAPENDIILQKNANIEYVRQLREKLELKDYEHLSQRQLQWSQDLNTDRDNYSDDMDFFRNPFKGTMAKPISASTIMSQVRRSFNDVFESVKFGSDSEYSKFPRLWTKLSPKSRNDDNASPSLQPSTLSPAVFTFSQRRDDDDEENAQVVMVTAQKKDLTSISMALSTSNNDGSGVIAGLSSGQQSLLQMLNRTETDVMGVTLCPLPTSPLADQTQPLSE